MKDKNLEVNSSANLVDLQKRNKEKNLSVIAHSPSLAFLQNQQVSSNTSTSIKIIHKEVNKEIGARETDKKRNQKFKTVSSAVNKFLSTFKQVKNKFHKFKKNNNKHEREKGFWETFEVPFNERERKVLLEVFQKYEELNKEKKTLAINLQNISGEDLQIIKDSLIKRPEVQSISSSLNRFGWHTPSLEKIEFKSRKGSSTKANSYGWGGWTSNPFKHFFEKEQDFIQLVDNLDKAKQRLDDYIASKRSLSLLLIIGGKSGQEAATPEKPKYVKAIADAELAIYMAVASKLMTWMGQN